jgi:hypothetical protein
VVRESLRLPWVPVYAILEFQSAFARRVRQRFHFAMVKESTTIENRFVDLLRHRALRDQLPDLLCRRTIGGVFSLERFLRRPGGNQRLARFVIDDLGVDVLAGKIYAKTRTLGGPGNLPPNAVVNAPANDFSINRGHHY